MGIPPSLTAGRDVIKRHLATMPGSPGVYRMLNEAGEAIYVGKANNLKNRVASYLNVAAMGVRLQRMVSHIASIDVTTTRSEAEALLLEANMVKKFSPRYNILLKDDKSFPYIFISGDHDYPRISKYRGAKTQKGKYFGPFVSASAVHETITWFQKAFLLRSCTDSVFKMRTRPCMLYQIKRCSAPCVARIGKEEYSALVDQATAFLSGKSQEIQQRLVSEMQEHSLTLHYEKARIIRDRIRALNQVQRQHGIEAAGIGDADILAVARDNAQSAVSMTSVRGGRNYGSKSWFPSGTESHSEGEILAAFISQHYQHQLAPPLILVSHLVQEASLIEEALRLNTNYKIEISQPVRGPKRDIVEQGVKNARQSLTREAAMNVMRRSALEGVAKLFNMEELPKRIEVYDNSHISGTHAIGAMIVAGQEGFIKAEYRKFNIKNQETVPGDDYAMMREVLGRRFAKLQEADGKKPDLVLIDGGLGQLSSVKQIFDDLGVQGVCLMAIAKGPDRNAGREHFFIPGREAFQLPEGDQLLHYFQRLRDEAHRFAIGAHRQRRSKAISGSKLDAIEQIGPGRKKALLQHFGSPRGVAAASVEDIARVPGISTSTAKIIYAYFHGEA